jgi:hypothetical protein
VKIQVPGRKDRHFPVEVNIDVPVNRQMRLRHCDPDLGSLDVRELRLSGLKAGGERKDAANRQGDESFHSGSLVDFLVSPTVSVAGNFMRRRYLCHRDASGKPNRLSDQ